MQNEEQSFKALSDMTKAEREAYEERKLAYRLAIDNGDFTLLKKLGLA